MGHILAKPKRNQSIVLGYLLCPNIVYLPSHPEESPFARCTRPVCEIVRCSSPGAGVKQVDMAGTAVGPQGWEVGGWGGLGTERLCGS